MNTIDEKCIVFLINASNQDAKLNVTRDWNKEHPGRLSSPMKTYL